MATHRINLNLSIELIEVIDAFAKMNGRSRTYVVEELLKPSVPSLKALLKLSDDLAAMTDAERLTAIAKLSSMEDKLKINVRNMPGHIDGVTK